MNIFHESEYIDRRKNKSLHFAQSINSPLRTSHIWVRGLVQSGSEDNGNFACSEYSLAWRLRASSTRIRGECEPASHFVSLMRRARRVCSKIKSTATGAFYFGAGNGNRTRTTSLGSWSSTTKLCLRYIFIIFYSFFSENTSTF